MLTPSPFFSFLCPCQRHQADVCHAYQILHAHGIDDDHVTVMMYDDIAHNWQNPSKGKIFNEPGGPDVYAGVKKDYTGKQITPKRFLSVLSGLNSTKDDDIFAHQSFSEHLLATKAPRCTAMAWIFILAYCFAIP